jgi:6-phosphogluconate dehydrogenase
MTGQARGRSPEMGTLVGMHHIDPRGAAEGSDIGMIGLAVMGENLVLNMVDHGWTVSVFNRTPSRTEAFLAREGHPGSIEGAYDLETFVATLARPRRIMMMIKAGQPVDDQLDQLLPLLSPGDVVIDGGNSRYTDTQRRCERLALEGIYFVGMGISGGEAGARSGPSIMPGGDAAAWPLIEDVFVSIAAMAGDEPVAAWVGPGGAGHYVKMVHNGIEYGDMQVIAEAYDVMRRGLDMDPPSQHSTFNEWNEGKLDSYLIEITADILGHLDDDGVPTLDRILDVAGQKGTGRWAVASSMDHGAPVTLVAESVYARMVSALDNDRRFASGMLPSGAVPIHDDPAVVIDDLHDALYASKIVSYAQGFMLLSRASAEFDWRLDLGTIAGLWRAGCIIRSHFLEDITAAYRANPHLSNILLDDYFGGEVADALPGWRRTVARAALAGIPVPAYSSALAFYDAFRSDRLPANLIQAQRDYFGAHMYERVDRPRGEWFHTNWTGHGGHVTSETYSA